MTGSSGPLHGVRVVDISSSYAAPTASMYLGDMGAEVIKIEPVRGDDARFWGPPFLNGEAAWFLSVNRNKRSICLDIREPAGRDVLFRLLASADVFVENLNPSKLEKHGLGLQSLAERFPHLVICALSGFGLTGPDAALPGYDLIAQARSGMMSVTGDDGVPQRVSTALSDVATGHGRRVRDRRGPRAAAHDRGGRDRRRRAPRGRSGVHGAPDRQLPRR